MVSSHLSPWRQVPPGEVWRVHENKGLRSRGSEGVWTSLSVNPALGMGHAPVSPRIVKEPMRNIVRNLLLTILRAWDEWMAPARVRRILVTWGLWAAKKKA